VPYNFKSRNAIYFFFNHQKVRETAGEASSLS
jgi:hypothetical protein